MKENIKSRLAAVKSFFNAVGVKVRYRTSVISENTVRSIRRAGRSAGHKTAEAILTNKKKIALGAVTMCAMVFCSMSLFNALTAYEYSYNGQVLGIVDEAEAVYEGIREAEQTLTEKVGAQVIIDESEDIEVKRVIRDSESVSEEQDVVSALTSIEEIKVLTYAINITSTVNKKTGETTTKSIYVDTEENAREVLESVKAEFTEDIDPEELVEATFDEDVSIAESKALIKDIVGTSAAFKAIMTGGIEEKIHKVKKGDSVADIAEKYGISREKLKKWNPDIGDDNILYLDQEIQLREQIPLLNVITKRNVTFTEDFEPEVEYTDTDKLYKGQEIVTKKGKSGNRTVNADIIEKNGQQIDRIDLSYTVHKEQKIRKIMRGTKEMPDTIGKGYYFYPMSGKFSSPFGNRWGRLHEGIDISGPTGTNIYAADAGVVTEAGATSNGYGIAVRIDHGNGRTTYYAHNNEVLVKVGDTVYRGQHIAESGNTGRSTGPHLHFETRFNGVPKDPTKYL